MIANLQKGFDNLSNEFFALKSELYKHNIYLKTLESIVINNSQNNHKYNENDDLKKYEENYDMKNIDEDHDSNTTETPNQNNELSRQYFTILRSTRPDIDKHNVQNSTSQQMILDQLSQLTNQFYDLQKKNAQLKQEISKNKNSSPLQSLIPHPSND